MPFDQKTIAQEQIWTYLDQENRINTEIVKAINGRANISYRAVDSLFLETPNAWADAELVISDNIPLRPTSGEFVPLYPEYWHIYHYQPRFQAQAPSHTVSCFMNRVSDDRSQMFGLIKKHDLLTTGLISFNCMRPGHAEPTREDVALYGAPFYNLIHSLEQSVVDSRIQIVLETYISDTHIAFSEKIFRALQLPRPWVLYCSPRSVEHLQQYGFDVLDDYVDHGYDLCMPHHERFQQVFAQALTFTDRTYTDHDLQRFDLAAQHNRDLLAKYAEAWPFRLQQVLEKIYDYD
jgi:hypothetical protein